MKKEISLETLQQWLKDPNRRVRVAAMNACQGREVPLDIIQQGMKDPDCDVRTAAMEACQGREVPLEIIQQGMKDPDWRVRTAAMEAYKERGIDLPILRTIEPPETVYKKCKFGVLICATIPFDAQIRGAYGQKCRASKAVITDVIGSVRGEPVGISKYDGRITYYSGDEVEIEDFDFSDKECAAGFHFFCTREEAENYDE